MRITEEELEKIVDDAFSDGYTFYENWNAKRMSYRKSESAKMLDDMRKDSERIRKTVIRLHSLTNNEPDIT